MTGVQTCALPILHHAYEIPATSDTAMNGTWHPAPGDALLTSVRQALGGVLPVVAEDLGSLTPGVVALRDRFALPGMRLLQDAFSADDHRSAPHWHPRDLVCYPGTHDNPTTIEWWAHLDAGSRARARAYMGWDGLDPAAALVRLAFTSPANTAIATMQDLLGLGPEARMNLPGTDVSAPSLTEKDRADIAFAVEQGVSYLALSFVRRAEDIEGLRRLVPKGMLLVAKIEKDSALERIDDILRASDAVMVARGDLGVELPFERVPLEQKRIIGLANRYGRPVITATQMLESMVEHPRPTRAEANDVANAVLDGTDAVMLSAETASGAFPSLAVQAMHRIAMAAETYPVSRGLGLDRLDPGSASVEIGRAHV